MRNIMIMLSLVIVIVLLAFGYNNERTKVKNAHVTVSELTDKVNSLEQTIARLKTLNVEHLKEIASIDNDFDILLQQLHYTPKEVVTETVVVYEPGGTEIVYREIEKPRRSDSHANEIVREAFCLAVGVEQCAAEF